jgi:hypothetical protein
MQYYATKRSVALSALTIELYLKFLEEEEGEQEATQI